MNKYKCTGCNTEYNHNNGKSTEVCEIIVAYDMPNLIFDCLYYERVIMNGAKSKPNWTKVEEVNE